MPQQGYGRNVKAQSDYGATRRAYQYSPRAAEDYLTGDQAAAYNAAKQQAFQPFREGEGFRDARRDVKAREDAFKRVDRLRDIASQHALGEFTQAASQLSKPYKLQASEGFLTEPDTTHTEPVMTAHPGRMAMTDKNAPMDANGNRMSWGARRQALTTRTYKPDEGFNLLKDDDSRLKLKAELEAKKQVGLGGATPQIPIAGMSPEFHEYYRKLLKAGPQGLNGMDVERQYVGY